MSRTTRAPRAPTAAWVIAVLLALIAGGLWRDAPSGGTPSAVAQSTAGAGARGVFAFTGQLDRDSYGLFMLDVDQGTLWCYEIESVGSERRLRLVAGRSWIYDRYLRDFNSAGYNWKQVQQLIEHERKGGSGTPAAPPAGDPPADAQSRADRGP